MMTVTPRHPRSKQPDMFRKSPRWLLLVPVCALAAVATLQAAVPPTISQVPPQVRPEGSPPFFVDVTVARDPAENDNVPDSGVTAASSRPDLVAVFDVSRGAGPLTWRLTLVPQPNASGTAAITVTAVDVRGDTATMTFDVILTPVNDPPVISQIPNPPVVDAGGSTGPLPFTVSDTESPAESLVVTASSDNAALVPNTPGALVLGGSGTNRTIEVRTVAGQSGFANITVRVTDPEGGTSATVFTVTVNGPPGISDIGDLTIPEDTPSGAIAFTVSDPDTPLDALALSASSSAPAVVPAANVQFGGSGGSRTLTVTPAPNASGTATITVRVSDGTLSAADTFVVTVTPVNDAPTIGSIADQTIGEDGVAGPLAFTVGDVEDGAGGLTLSATSSDPALLPPGNIAFGGSGATRTVTLTPVQDRHGSTTVTLTVTDSAGATASASFTLTVTPADDPPEIAPIPAQATSEDTPVTVQVSVADADTPLAAVTLAATSSNQALVPNGNLAIAGDGAVRSLTIQPAPDQSGATTITVTATDGTSQAVPRSFTLTVNAVNDAPTISTVPDQAIAEDSSTGDLPFTVGDVETPVAALVVEAQSSNTALVPASGIALGGSGATRTVRVTPAANQSGTAVITIRVQDADIPSLSAISVFTVTVLPVDDPPTLADVGDTSTSQDITPPPIAVAVGDPDTPLSSLVLTATSSNQVVLPNAGIAISGSGAVRTLTLSPAAGQTGTTVVTLVLSDGTSQVQDTFTFTVTAPDGPTVSDIANQVIDEDGSTGPIAFTVGDPQGIETVASVTAVSSNPAIVPNAPANVALGGSGASRTITVTPAPNQYTTPASTVAITITVTDHTGLTAVESFTVTVRPVNDAPALAAIPNQVTDEDVPRPVTVTITDPDPTDVHTLTATSSNTAVVANAGLAFSGTGLSRVLTVTPVANAAGTAVITVTVSDGATPPLTAQRTFTITVNAVNDAPTVSPFDDRTTPEDTPAGPFAFTIADAETPAANLSVTATSSNQTVLPNSGITLGGSGGTRTIRLSPAANQSGTTTVTVRVSDGSAATQVSFTLTVEPANDAPTFASPTLGNRVTQEDVPLENLSIGVNDPDDPANTLQLSATSSNPTLLPHANVVLSGTGTTRTVSFLPAANQHGVATVTFTLSDGRLTAQHVMTLTVTAVNDPPTVSSIPGQTVPQGTQTVGPLSFVVGDADVDDPPDSLNVTAVSSNTAVLTNAGIQVGGAGSQRSLTLTPVIGATGATQVSVRVGDGQVTTTTSFVLTINPVACTFDVALTRQSFPTTGDTAVATVATSQFCEWSAQADQPWVRLPDGGSNGVVNGAGNGAVRIAVAANPAAGSRAATLTVAGRAFVLVQEGTGTCAYAASPTALAFGVDGGGRTLQVTGGASQCAWTLVPAAPQTWLQATPAEGVGSGQVAVTVLPNAGDLSRVATLLLRNAAGATVQEIRVAQDGATSGDADGDGLPSTWEAQFGLDAASASGENGALGDPDGDGITNLEERRNCDRPIGCTHPRGFTEHTRYLAEGASSTFFDTRFALFNPGTTTATVLLRFQKSDGTATTHYLALPPMSRRTVVAAGVDGLQQAEFSTVVESDEPVVIDRTMSWDRSGYGSHAETGLRAPRTLWYFAEGATLGNFDLFYLLQNPSPVAADVEVTYLLPSGPPVRETYTVAPGSRFNIWVDTLAHLPQLTNAEISAVVRSTNGVPILAERAMYLSTPGRWFLAGHESAAVAEPRTEWFLAEGATGDYFDLFVLVANPADRVAEIEARYLLTDGTVITKPYSIAPNSRFNIWVDLEDPRLANAEISTAITSTNGVPVIVERAMWWPGPTPATWSEAHNSAGATSTGTRWALAEGEQGGASGVETYVLIANTSPAPGEARVTLVFEDGATEAKVVPLLPNSRLNVPIGSEFPSANGRRFGVIVESLGASPAQIVVERAMYANSGGIHWAAGSNALATRLQ